jgi:polysaccharide pyruvyl transferase WcaK-like protein
MLLRGIAQELRDYARAFVGLRGTDVFIVPGTGLLTDAFGLADWGPFNLFKWTLMAKLRRCRIMLVSVGAGPIDTWLGRTLVTWTLSLADYTSCRDAESSRCLETIGSPTKGANVYPDLVFGLPEDLIPSPRGNSNHRRVVGLGLMFMPQSENYSFDTVTQATYESYLESLVAFVEWLLAHNYDIRLLLGDNDYAVIQDFESLLRQRLEGYEEERVIAQPTLSVDEILMQLSATDVVVATRFHNLLLALWLKKPAIAISFHHKCTSLMAAMELMEYCIDIRDLSGPDLITQFQALESDSLTVTSAISKRVDEYRAALDEQYEALFEGP